MAWAAVAIAIGTGLAAGAGTAAELPSNATNATTGVVRDASSITRALPLKQLRLITPDAGRVSGTDAVTLVFSRAVIALGSNFHGGDNSAAHGVEPLLWTCNDEASGGAAPLPGRTWWVTTAIVRFDPAVPWPNDLHCEVQANPQLRSFDDTPQLFRVCVIGPEKTPCAGGDD